MSAVRPQRDAVRPGIPAGWLFVFFAACYVLTSSGRIEGGDAGTMYQVTRNMIEYGTVALRAQLIPVPVQNYPGFLPTRAYVVETASLVYNGRLGYDYSPYGWGMSLAAAPLYWVGRALDAVWPGLGPQFLARMLVQLLGALLLAGAAVALADLAHWLHLSLRLSVGLAFAFGFATCVWPYVKTFYSEPAVTWLVLLAALGLRRYELSGRAACLFRAGLCLGLSLVFRPTALLAAPALGVYLLAVLRGQAPSRAGGARQVTRAILAGVAGCLPGLTVVGVYTWLRFGSLLSMKYTRMGWDTPPLNGLYGLLFSPGKGLFVYCPILLLGLGGMLLLWRSHRGVALMVAVLCATYVLFHAPYSFWTGGWNWGPRFLMPVIPFLMLPVGFLLQEARSKMAVALFALLFAVGVGIQLPAVLVNHSRDMIALSEQYDRFYDKTIYEVSLSPVIRQWPVAIEVLGRFAHSEAWAEARRAIADARSDWVRADASDDVVAAGLTKESEFIRNNVPDFWWVYLYLAGASPWAIAVPVVVLLLIAGVSAFRVFRQLSIARTLSSQP